MFMKFVFSNHKARICILVTFIIIYVLGLLLVTIAFFTPYWLHGVTRYSGLIYIYGFINGRFILGPHFFVDTCQTVGLISGQCRYPYNRDFVPTDGVYIIYTYYPAEVDKTRELANDMTRTFSMALMTMCIQYVNLAMTLVTLRFGLFENKIYMSFLSITYGVLYPIGGISLLISTIVLEIEYKSDVGFSTILATVSGGLMCLFYAGLWLYNYHYIKYMRSLEYPQSSSEPAKWTWTLENASYLVGYEHKRK